MAPVPRAAGRPAGSPRGSGLTIAAAALCLLRGGLWRSGGRSPGLMSDCSPARRKICRGRRRRMAAAGPVCKCPRTRLPVGGASALCVFVLCWLYIFPVYRLPDEKEVVQGVLLQQGKAWRSNQTAVTGFRKQLEDCCDPGQLFAMTKQNSPLGKNLWFDGEFLHSVTIDNATYSLFPQATPFQLPLKKCSVVGNGGILKKSGCGRQIDQADFVMRCNLPPLSSEYTKDVGSKTQLVTANPSIIEKRFQNLLWSRKTFVDSVKVYNHSYIYMPAFSMKTGTEPSLRVYYTLEDFGANQTVLFANPNFLRDIGKFWKSRGIHAKRLSTGLFLVSAALGLCEEVTIYGFWPFSVDLHGRFISHHYYDNVLPDSGFHAMPEEFLQLWFLHKNGVLRMQLEQCEAPLLQSSA
ncbi:alpha-N-acetylneuraminide alpha-2,8-sialyltransferase [Terrapene carolina triunguis]|uniref:alpha-N-acetylneuraminide alpha-2,8-sialyltransferase n=1 Tax=Terrapene triunguis TaxID=2587831 RepID=UPI000E77A1A2|nr:alpha-N-acetylneuraminide alpha-2,8-sialyltransferase [Terrapene carolina triunguis]